MFGSSQHLVCQRSESDSYYPEMDRADTKGPIPAEPMMSRLDELGWSQADFARKLNVSEQVVTNWKRRGIPRGEIYAVAKTLRMTVEQFLEQPRKGKVAAFKSVRKTDSTGPLTIPIFDVQGSMGGGRIVEATEPIVGGMTISREWARAHLPAVTSFQNLAVISAYGDSMSPTFSDGDILLIDRGVSDVKADAVYVIGRGDELFIKRVQRRLVGETREYIIRSDNPQFGPETITGAELARFRVLGRVVWAWNGKRL